MGGPSLPRRRVGYAVLPPRRGVWPAVLPPRRGVWPAVVCLLALLLGAVTPTALAANKPKPSTPATTTASSPTATAAATPAVTPLPSSSNPLSGGVPLSPAQTTTTPTVIPNVSTAGSGSSNLSSGSALAIVVGALVVLVGISFFIWRDARRRAPIRAANAAAGSEGRRTGSKAPPKPRKLSSAERKRRKRGRAKPRR
jgi:hypothetical protein